VRLMKEEFSFKVQLEVIKSHRLETRIGKDPSCLVERSLLIEPVNEPRVIQFAKIVEVP